MIRNLATLGGNICQSSVAGDGLAACVTLNADVTIKSVRGERTININEFLSSPDRKRNILQPDELMTEVSFPLPDTKHTATAFYKLGKRRALAISVIGGGMVVTVDDNGVCTYCSMRAGAMARYPQRYKSCEEYLVGKKLSWIEDSRACHIQKFRNFLGRRGVKTSSSSSSKSASPFCKSFEAVSLPSSFSRTAAASAIRGGRLSREWVSVEMTWTSCHEMNLQSVRRSFGESSSAPALIWT